MIQVTDTGGSRTSVRGHMASYVVWACTPSGVQRLQSLSLGEQSPLKLKAFLAFIGLMEGENLVGAGGEECI